MHLNIFVNRAIKRDDDMPMFAVDVDGNGGKQEASNNDDADMLTDDPQTDCDLCGKQCDTSVGDHIASSKCVHVAQEYCECTQQTGCAKHASRARHCCAIYHRVLKQCKDSFMLHLY